MAKLCDGVDECGYFHCWRCGTVRVMRPDTLNIRDEYVPILVDWNRLDIAKSINLPADR